MPPKTLPGADLFAGTTEVGALLRNIAWEKTSLGSIEFWPQSLKTALRIMMTSRQPIWVGWGTDLIYFYNDAYKPIIGGRHPWALGKPVREVWPELWGDIADMLSTAMTGVEGTYVEEQLLIMERNGYPEETYYTFSYSPIPDDDNNPGGIICANTDDTQRVIGERQLALLRDLAALETHTKSLRAACQESVRRLASNSKDFPFCALYMEDPETGELGLIDSSGFEKDHSATPSELNDKEFPVWPYKDALDKQQLVVVDDLHTHFDSELPCGFWKQHPNKAAILPLVTSNEKQRAILIVGLNPYRLFDDNYQSFLTLVAGQIAAGITNVFSFEQAKKRAEALAELDKAKTLFFSNVSHEFRTPLTLLLGPLEEAMASLDFESEAKTALELAYKNGLRLLKLVNSLLDFSRAEAGRMQAAYLPIDLAALTADLASNFRSACERAGLTLSINCEALAEPVYIDRDMWEKIVFNLLSNAFKFTFEGEIEVQLRAQQRSVQLIVSDTGVGIRKNDLPRIFERFHRVENSRGRSHEGTGIGLALVKELVRLHGGEINVSSTFGEGTRFIIEIPFGKNHLPASQIGVEKTQISTATRAAAYVEETLRWLPNGEQTDAASLVALDDNRVSTLPHILLADDNADMRIYIHRILKDSYRVTTVEDGHAAWEQVLNSPPDLILSDVMMPLLDGFGLLKKLKSKPELMNIPIILLSARAGQEARIEGIDAGADDYLVKPFSTRELRARVKAQLAKYESRKEQEDHFRIMADNSPAILWTTTPDAACTYLSKQWYHYTGGTPEEDLGFGWLNKIHKDDYEQAKRIFMEANQSQISFRIEYRLRGADGKYNWAIDAGIPRFDEDGVFLGYVGCVFDISDRRGMEVVLDGQKQALELGITDAALSRVLEVFTTAIEKQSNSGVLASFMLIDEEEKHLLHGAAPRLPESFNEFIHGIPIGPEVGSFGASAYMRQPVWVGDIETNPLWDKFKALALSNNLKACWSCPVISSEGMLLGVFLLYYPEKLEEPDPADVRAASIFTSTASLIIDKIIDARLRKAADTKLRVSEAALREADKRKDEFLATLAHELRNPLAPISNAVQIMQMVQDPTYLLEMRELIGRQITQMTHLIDDLMDVSRITRGKVELRKELITLNSVIDNAVETVRPIINEYKHELNYAPPAETISINADFVRLSQVFTNVLHNAAKYTPPGGRIEISVKTDKRHVSVEICDNGRGIPPDRLPFIFEMFSQVEEPLGRGQSGLGLGLTLADQLMRLHKGELTATSEGLGKGSTFTVKLPVAETKAKSAAPPSSDFISSATTLKVLIVDDNQESANTLGKLIKLFGHEIVVVYDGASAIRATKDFTPDLVLLDIGMPEMNGYEVCKLLRKIPALHATKFVAQTGWSEKKHHSHSLEAGFDFHLVKPIDLSKLKTLIASLNAEVESL